jgi:polyisoprenoid-binding protein YceI
MTTNRKKFPIILALFTVALRVSAAPEDADFYKIDPVHSSVQFSVKHVVGYVTGSFSDLSGTITIDKTNSEHSAISVVILTDSINTGNAVRDTALKGPEFLDTENFSFISFSTRHSSWKKTGDDTYDIPGYLRIRDTEKGRFILKAQLLGSVTGKDGKKIIGWKAHGTVQRTPFGVKGPPMVSGMIGEDIDVVINIEAIQID